ncbi:MAG TPA: geranylgeranylglycerol-phosphate geranylgeranyltransferase [Bacteroidia bacterium]|nr:geranylgeranylglycerol-phosphate geranylgeranyltransferase [Bacteroidia bacterium]
MNQIKSKYLLVYSFAKLIRIENLLLMALVIYVSHNYIFRKEAVALSPLVLLILILSTISIAAGGYVINDYFDLKIDKINKPNEIILEKFIHRKAGIIWHLIFSILGLLGGLFLAYTCRHWSLVIIQIISIALLLVYSNFLKKIFILGNLTIAILSGFLPLLPYIYLNSLYPQISLLTTNALVSLSAFAFFTTIIRELIKDIQDVKGDSIGGRKTIPVVWGVLPSRIIVFFLLLLLIILLLPFMVYYYINNQYDAVLYHLFLLILPSIILMILVIKISIPEKYKLLSAIMKLIMLSGIIFYTIF